VPLMKPTNDDLDARSLLRMVAEDVDGLLKASSSDARIRVLEERGFLERTVTARARATSFTLYRITDKGREEASSKEGG